MPPAGRLAALGVTDAGAQIDNLISLAAPLQPDPTYLLRIAPGEFDERYREKVIKYINELADDFGLLAQTGSIACNYFNRYIPIALGHGPVGRRMMQVIASTCVLIAAKFIDRKLPPLSELVAVHKSTVLATEFAETERTILAALHWQLHVPQPHAFVEPLRACLPEAPFNPAIEDRMQFFIDLSVYSYKMLEYSPAETLGGALIGAWKFSDDAAAIVGFLPHLAQALRTTETRLKLCTNDLVRYYKVCFPTVQSRAVESAVESAPLLAPTPSPQLVPPPVSAVTPERSRPLAACPMMPAESSNRPGSEAAIALPAAAQMAHSAAAKPPAAPPSPLPSPPEDHSSAVAAAVAVASDARGCSPDTVLSEESLASDSLLCTDTLPPDEDRLSPDTVLAADWSCAHPQGKQ
mmetsp:Transcript_16915/g.43432  ORF Transcript_16915/g.43432 Transcript_16915/m.43432 type:complete len:408 (-) Transcript_16915:843-2066(-)